MPLIENIASAASHIQIETLLQAHETWRGSCINLTASENALSPAVRSLINSDLLGRYGDYTGRDLSAHRYQGTRYIEAIERLDIALAQEVFAARYVELRAISGHVAGAAVVMGLASPGDVVLEVGPQLGSHRLATKLALAKLIDLKVHFLPANPLEYDLDLPACLDLIHTVRPRLILLGSSSFLFPHPVAELAQAAKAVNDALIVYDASHVLGLIAGKRFQQPLAEGADIVFGSTHKTFPGPQGGIIFTDNNELMDKVIPAVYPAQVTNHHVFRLPALGMALCEMKEFGQSYADQVIRNSQALGKAIAARDVELVERGGCPSMSHTLLLKVAPFGSATQISDRLEAANIIVTQANLAEELGGAGVRIGTQEITRLGATETEMDELAELVVQAIRSEPAAPELLSSVQQFAQTHNTCAFTWPSNP